MQNNFTAFFDRASKFFIILLAFAIPVGIAPQEIAFVLLILCCILSGQWYGKFQTLKTNHIALLFLLLALWIECGFLYTPKITADSLKYGNEYASLLVVFLMIFCVKENLKLRYYCYISAICGALFVNLAALLLISYASQTHTTLPATLRQIIGLAHHDITNSMILAFTAFLSLHLMRVFTATKTRIALIMSFLVLSACLFFQNVERTGMLIYVALAFISIFQVFGTKNIKKLMASFSILVALFILLFFVSPVLHTRILAMLSNFQLFFQHTDYNTSMGTRMYENLGAIRLFLTSPIIGHGLGSYHQLFHTVAPRVPNIGTPVVAENSFMFIAAEHGGIGLLLLFSLLFFQLRYALLNQNTVERHMGILLIVSFLIFSVSQATLRGSVSDHFYLLFSALLFSNPRTLKQVFTLKKTVTQENASDKKSSN